MTADTSPNSNEANDRAAQIIAQALSQALMEAEVVISAERDARAQTLSLEVTGSLERFSMLLEQLVNFSEQIGERMSELTDAVVALAEAQQQAASQPAKPQLPDLEASFVPGGEGIDVTIGSVPGFQGLMELQRALVRLPQVQSAAVRRYQDDEASIQLVLAQPMTPTSIAEGVTASTGHRIFVEEARPDALRLRLRFIDGS